MPSESVPKPSATNVVVVLMTPEFTLVHFQVSPTLRTPGSAVSPLKLGDVEFSVARSVAPFQTST